MGKRAFSFSVSAPKRRRHNPPRTRVEVRGCRDVTGKERRSRRKDLRRFFDNMPPDERAPH